MAAAAGFLTARDAGTDVLGLDTAGLVGELGGFYLQSDIGGLVAYAGARGIRIIPEIDLPGHARGMLPLEHKRGVTVGAFTRGVVARANAVVAATWVAAGFRVLDVWPYGRHAAWGADAGAPPPPPLGGGSGGGATEGK